MKRSKYTLNKRKLLPIFAVVGILAGIGGVFAANQDSAIFPNLFNLGFQEAEYVETFTSPEDWKTCQEVPKTVVTTNNGTGNFKVRLSYDEYWRNAADTDNLPLVKDGETLAIINFQNEDDWTRHGDWYYYNYEVEPGQSTNSLLKSVTLNCDANMGKDNVCTETPTGVVCEKPEDSYESATYHLNVTVQTTSGEFPREDEFYDVTINPNGGTFQGSSEPYVASLQYGTEVDLSSIAYADHEFNGWTLSLNGEEQAEPYTEDSITIDDHTTLTANWRWGIFHDVTVNPNGGSYDGSTEPVVTSVRHADSFTLPTTEPTREDYLFDGWAINGSIVSDSSISVLEDTELVAQWSPVVARIESTGTLFRSVTAANTSASSGDTITLLKDTEEEATITKNVTLDLDEHVLSGSITNNGNLTLLNGEVNNDSGAAVTNNGSLTMGIDDHDFDGDAHIVSDYVRLIGTDTGLDQNGTFYFYDGFIEGEIALDGGYDGSPFFRKAWDEEIVYYFPFVDNVNDGEMSYQHAELESSDLAVSKTAVHGDIYYYSIQDNINTSLRTGYKIYIVRDDFDTGEALTVPVGGDITIDIDGHSFTATDTITVNGKLTIEDSKTTVETVSTRGGSSMPTINGNVFTTPHNEEHTITTVTYAGNIVTPQTTIVNGELVVNKAKMAGTTVNDAVSNNGTLTMANGALGTTTGYAFRPNSNETYNLDDNSYLFSTSTNKAAVYVANQDFTWSKGNIYGAYQAIYADSGSKQDGSQSPVNINITGGQIIANGTNHNTYGIYGNCTYNSFYCKARNLSMTGGQIKVNSTSSLYGHSAYGVANLTAATIDTGDKDTPAILSTAADKAQTFAVSETATTINNSNITASSESSIVYGFYSSTVSANNSNIILSGAYGAGIYGGINMIEDSSITITGTSTSTSCNPNNTSRSTYGINQAYSYAGSIKNTSITVRGSNATTCDHAYGIYKGNTTLSILEGTNINALNAGGNNYGIYSTSSNGLSILGGRIYGEDYGVYSNNGYTVTIGSNDGTIDKNSPEIIGDAYALYGGDTGYFKFYDGILRGEIEAHRDGTVKEIADNADTHLEYQTIDGTEYETRWLIEEQDVAQIGETKYKKLSDAITAAEAGQTINLLTDNYIFPALTIPAEKEFTIETNGYKIILGNPITNNGNVTIINETPNAPTIKYYSSNYAIVNSTDATLSLAGIDFDVNYGISNSGTLSMIDVSIVASATAIKNTGNITAHNNISLGGGTYSIYNDGGESSISDVTASGKSIYVNNGSLTLANGTATISGELLLTEYITNKGTLSLNSMAISYNTKATNSYTSSTSKAIYNTGILSVSNNSSVSYNSSATNGSSVYGSAVAIYNEGGTTVFSDSSIALDATNATSNTSNAAYAVYSPTGSFTIESGSIHGTAKGNVYGIYTNSGTVVIGVPEPTSSPDYGRDTADVSTTSPDISAISTSTNSSYKTGIGVKNAAGGRVEYYDGKVSGNTAAFGESPAVTEHFYEICTETDTSVTPNLIYSQLFWVRESGQSPCSN